METRASYLLVGSFTLALIIAMVTAVVWLAGVALDEDSAYYDILFESSVTGLSKGNVVQYRGVPVGVVTDMRINRDNVEQIRVTIEVPKPTPIREDTVAELEMQGLTGVAMVQLSGGTNEAPPLTAKLGERPVIDSRPSQLQAVFEAAPQVLNRITTLLENANRLLNDQNQSNFETTLANIATVSGTFADGSNDVRALLSDAAAAVSELKEAAVDARALASTLNTRVDSLTTEADLAMGDARGLLQDARANLNGISTDARATLQSLARVSDSLGGEVGGIGPELRAAVQNFGESQARLSALIEENREPLSNFTSSGLYEFTQFLAEARALVAALSRVTNQIERDPARFLFGDQQRGVGVP